jgi:multiple sugar transport system ATP-binding protein
MTFEGRDVIARLRANAQVRAGVAFEFAVNMEKAIAFDPATEERILP